MHIRQWLDVYQVYTLLTPGYIKCGKFKKALLLLEELLNIVQNMDAVYAEAHVHLLMAGVYFEIKESDALISHLSMALEIGNHYHYDFLFARREKEITQKLLPDMLNLTCHQPFTYRIAIQLNESGKVLIPVLSSHDKQSRLYAIKSLSDLECREAEKHLLKLTRESDKEVKEAAKNAVNIIRSLPPYPLTIYSLGKFRIVQNGHDISHRFQRRSAAIPVFQHFILNHGVNIPTDRIQELFFSHSKTRDPKSILHQTITAIRTALEPGIAPKRKSLYILVNNTSYRFELPADSYVDVFEFEKLSLKAKKTLLQKDEYTALDIYQKALNLYQGNLFEEYQYHDWIIPIRQRMLSIFQDCLQNLSDILYRQLEYEACCQALDRLIDSDPWNEQAYLLLMKCHYKMGRRDKVISTYKTCRNNLSRDLAILPEEELTRFYHSVK